MNIQELERILTKLQKEEVFVNREIKQCPDGKLMQSRSGETTVYFQVMMEDGKRVRRSITRKPGMIQGLARKKYLEIQQERIQQNILTIQKALTAYADMSTDTILQQAMDAYNGLPAECFLTSAAEDGYATMPMKKWADMPYEQSAYMPERKIHMTSRGLLVRSKSEVMIAEKLDEYNVPFRYEQVLTIGKYTVAPDFTVMRQDGELWYWEHCGLTNNKKYMEHHKWKLNLYESVGIVPWKNLIVTYDEEDGTINMQIIESEIRNKLM